MLVGKWISILRHAVTNREAKSIKWLKPGSPGHIALEEVVKNKKRIKDLAELTEFHHTGELEQYHSIMLKCVPKCEHFSYNGMIA